MSVSISIWRVSIDVAIGNVQLAFCYLLFCLLSRGLVNYWSNLHIPCCRIQKQNLAQWHFHIKVGWWKELLSTFPPVIVSDKIGHGEKNSACLERLVLSLQFLGKAVTLVLLVNVGECFVLDLLRLHKINPRSLTSWWKSSLKDGDGIPIIISVFLFEVTSVAHHSSCIKVPKNYHYNLSFYL